MRHHYGPSGFSPSNKQPNADEAADTIRQPERELALWKDRAERVIKERDRIGRELAAALERERLLKERK